MTENDQKQLGKTLWNIADQLRGAIVEHDYNLNISRYVSTAQEVAEVDLAVTHAELVRIEDDIRKATAKHNEFLKELGLPLLPLVSLEEKR